jgi:hypothetical protein
MLVKTQNAQVAGKYTETTLDNEKQTVDFRLLQVSPNYIQWNNGGKEIVSAFKLASLQKKHTWLADF